MVARLAKATGEGRITLEEFSDAAGAAYAAVTLAELDDLYRSFGLIDALPAPPAAPHTPGGTSAGGAAGAGSAATGGGSGVGGSQSASTPATPSTATSTAAEPATASPAAVAPDNVIAIMSGADRKGRWSVKPRTRAVAFWGGVKLDLRDAVIASDVVDIEAWAVMGSVHVIVPEGIPVELSGLVVMGGRTSRVADVEPLPGAPLVRVHARGLWGGVDVRSRRSRRAGGSAGGPAAPSRDGGDTAPGPTGRNVQQNVNQNLNRNVNQNLDQNLDQNVHVALDVDRTVGRHDDPGDGPSSSGDLLTVVCTDIVGSTRLAVALGDQRWHAVLSEHNALVRSLLARFGGTEVKTIGDGFLLTFTSARAALQFSMALQDDLAADAGAGLDAPLELRVGVHAGEVERDGHDVIGRNVTIACRLCDVAAPGEVLASAVVADLADSASDLTFGPPRAHQLAGIDRPLQARPAIRA